MRLWISNIKTRNTFTKSIKIWKRISKDIKRKTSRTLPYEQEMNNIKSCVEEMIWNESNCRISNYIIDIEKKLVKVQENYINDYKLNI